ncbi:MAG: hypothetical protein IPO15_25880 [Anaerolineae bacterium]|uniref:FTR1 family protein n=1 Tax=Candidatus Amarolinea dominans TaxID=3140696 RepID=UPI003136ED63|nr:hypothetical protein [Anaerolineae bacterium]
MSWALCASWVTTANRDPFGKASSLLWPSAWWPALLLYAVGLEMEGATEQIFEGVTMLWPAAILTWMIFWMQTQGRRINRGCRTGIARRSAAWVAIRAIGPCSAWPSLLSYEGIETALFLTATTFTAERAGRPADALPGLNAPRPSDTLVCHHPPVERQALLPG